MTNRFESKIARLFKAKGYYTVVSAGSRGVADVVALNGNETLRNYLENSVWFDLLFTS